MMRRQPLQIFFAWSAPLALQNRLNPRSTKSTALPDQSLAPHIPRRNKLSPRFAAGSSSEREQ